LFFKLVHTGYKEQPGAAWHECIVTN